MVQSKVPQINFDFQTSVSQVSDYVDVMDAATFKAFVQKQIEAGVVASDAMNSMGTVI